VLAPAPSPRRLTSRPSPDRLLLEVRPVRRGVRHGVLRISSSPHTGGPQHGTHSPASFEHTMTPILPRDWRPAICTKNYRNQLPTFLNGDESGGAHGDGGRNGTAAGLTGQSRGSGSWWSGGLATFTSRIKLIPFGRGVPLFPSVSFFRTNGVGASWRAARKLLRQTNQRQRELMRGGRSR
jgi:hypothetical protein